MNPGWRADRLAQPDATGVTTASVQLAPNASLGRGSCRQSAYAAGVLVSALLAACTGLPLANGDQARGHGRVQSFSLSGRLAIRQNARSDTLILRWEHGVLNDRLALSTPLGNQVMLLEEQPGRATLTLPGRAPVEAVDDASLMQDVVGYALPVQGLAQWVSGVVPAAAITPSADGDAPDTVHFSENGWTGVLERWRMVGDARLPGLISISRAALHLRLVVDTWSVRRADP